MYCVKCGVRLQNGAEKCPLCETPVWNPTQAEEERPFPATLPRHHSESDLPGAVWLTVLCVIAFAVVLAVCFKLYGQLRWGVYALGGIALFYLLAVLPRWFRNPSPVVFLPIDHAGIALYALLVCLKSGGHWFLSFAFPVIGLSALLSTAMVTLLRRLRRGRLYVFGGFLILLGGFTMLIEFFEHISFGLEMFRWSLYSMSCCGIAGLALLLTAMIRPLREALEKRFFF